jgi:hypothetical protein
MALRIDLVVRYYLKETGKGNMKRTYILLPFENLLDISSDSPPTYLALPKRAADIILPYVMQPLVEPHLSLLDPSSIHRLYQRRRKDSFSLHNFHLSTW